MSDPRSFSFPREHSPSWHICMIFDDEEQRRRTVSEYLAAGLRDGDQVRYAADTTPPEVVRGWVNDSGLEISEGAFQIITSQSFYCPDGRFDPRRTVASLPARYAQSKAAGFRGSRVCAEMGWALRGFPGSEGLLEYEALLNTVNDPFPHTGMCCYDARHFDGATLFKVMQVHPFMVANGQVVRNPFFVRPDELPARS